MKTRNCDQCAHFSVIEKGEPVRLKICAKDHKPRFYQPKRGLMGWYNIDEWGWKRRCDDFDAVVTIEIRVTR